MEIGLIMESLLSRCQNLCQNQISAIIIHHGDRFNLKLDYLEIWIWFGLLSLANKQIQILRLFPIAKSIAIFYLFPGKIFKFCLGDKSCMSQVLVPQMLSGKWPMWLQDWGWTAQHSHPAAAEFEKTTFSFWVVLQCSIIDFSQLTDTYSVKKSRKCWVTSRQNFSSVRRPNRSLEGSLNLDEASSPFCCRESMCCSTRGIFGQAPWPPCM